MHDGTFSRPDLTKFCRLDELGLRVVGQRLEPDRAVLACRVVEPDQWCRRCGCEGVPRDTVVRRLAHEPLGWRPTILLVTIVRYRCAGCGHVWRQDTSRAAEPRAKLSRRGLRWALEGIVCQHLSVARVAEGLAVAWNTANVAVLAEGKRVLISDTRPFDGVEVIGVDEHVWRHTRGGGKYVTVIIDLTAVRRGTGPARLLDMVEGRSKQAFKSWRQPADRPPWVRVVVQIACGQVGADTDWPSIRASFESFLRTSAIAELLADLTHVGQDEVWARQATSTSSIIDMVLGDGVASARLELPDGIRRHGRVEGYALLIVHVEPRGVDGAPALPASPASWRRRFEQALQLPAAFATLLSGELGQATSGQPPARAGIRLEAPDMTDLVDVTGLAILPGAQGLSQFMVYLAACPGGVSTVSAADRMTRQMLEEALKADLDSGIELQADHAG
jgi:Transposase